MPDLGQREPRQRDEDYLQFVRSLPCCICNDNTSCEAHHIRLGSIENAKRYVGLAEKSSDKWALPLCSHHHHEIHTMSEREFWASYGLDPFALAMHYYRRPR